MTTAKKIQGAAEIGKLRLAQAPVATDADLFCGHDALMPQGKKAERLAQQNRQMRGTAPAQIPGARISVCHGVGGMFAASGTIIMSNE